jgi:hypothetical protein
MERLSDPYDWIVCIQSGSTALHTALGQGREPAMIDCLIEALLQANTQVAAVDQVN